MLGMALGTVLVIGPGNPRKDVSYTSDWVTHGATRPGVTVQPAKKAALDQTLYQGYLTYKTYTREVVAYGSPETFKGGLVYAPGHHLAAVAVVSLDAEGRPLVFLRADDRKFSRWERQEPFSLDAVVSGRLGEQGREPEQVARAELSGLVGEVMSLRPTGVDLTPSMPLESTECDLYFVALVDSSTKLKAYGPQEAWKAFSDGSVSDGGRAQALYGRAFDSMGYLRSHALYVKDYPKLYERFDTLGSGALWEPKGLSSKSVAANAGRAPSVRVTSVGERSTVALDVGEMVKAKVRIAIGGSKKETSDGISEYLKLPYDRLKLVEYYQDPERGPMVRFSAQVRAPLEFAPGAPKAFRKDVSDTDTERSLKLASTIENVVELGKRSSASAALSDLYYRFAALAVEKPHKPTGEGYLPLAEALRECRSGQGDAQTEALLLRLADHLRWNPNLGLSWEEIDRFVEL